METSNGVSKTTKIVVGVIVIVLVMVGVLVSKNKKGQEPANSQSKNQTYKIGVLLPLSGDTAVYAEPARKVYQIAVDEINAQAAANAQKLELVIEDDKCNGQDAASATQKLVNADKIQVILGSLCSSATLAALPIAEAAKVAVFSPGATSPKLTGSSAYFFRDVASDDSQGQVDAETAYKKGLRKVAFIVEQQDYPLGIYGSFQKRFTELGGQVVKEEFAQGTTDFKSQLAKLKSQNPDALFVDPQAPPAGARILKQLKDLNWKPQLFITETEAGDQKFLADNKEFLEGAIGSEFLLDLENPKSKHLLAAYKEKFGQDLPYQSYGHTEYDSIYLLKAGIEAVGYSGEKLSQWSRTIKDFDGASGKITIKPDGDRASGNSPEIVKNGKIELFKD